MPSPPAAMVLVHGPGACYDQLAALSSRYRGQTRLALFDADVDAHAGEVEAFMSEVAVGDFALVHVIPAAAADAPAAAPGEASDGVAEGVEAPPVGLAQRVEAVDALFRQRYPALEDVDAWVAMDVGRAWNEQAREAVQQVAEIAGEVRVKRVFAVCGSTDVAVAGRQPDIDGMLADLAWNLALSDLGGARGLDPAVWVWAVGSQSFTFDGLAWTLLATSDSISEAIRERPLAPADEALLDASTAAGAQWVRDCTIGTDAERARLTSAGRGDVMERLVVDQSVVEAVAPEDWATAIEREHKRLLGAPLANFTRVVQGRAQAELDGPLGDPEQGLIRRFDVSLTSVLRQPSGCLRAGRYLSGVAEELRIARERVEHLEQHDPKSFDLEGARVDLEASVAALPDTRPWLVRMGLLALAGIVLTVAAPWVVAALLPALAVLIAGGWLMYRRRKVIKLRRRLIDLVEQRVRAIATSRLIAAEVGLIKDLEAHVGEFLDKSGIRTEMEHAVAPTENTRAYDVHRIWLKLKGLAAQFADSQLALAAWKPLPSLGRFFQSFPDDAKDASAAFQRDADDVVQLRKEVRRAADDVLAQIEVDWTDDELHDRLLAAADEVAQPGLKLARLADMQPAAAAEAVAQLQRRNAPHLDQQLEMRTAKVVVGPPEGLPGDFASLGQRDAADEAGLMSASSADDRRVSVLWLRPQDFARPAQAPRDDEFEDMRRKRHRPADPSQPPPPKPTPGII